MATDLVIGEIRTLPDGIEDLRAAGSSEGFHLIERLIDEWNDGSKRFDQPGEKLLEVRSGQHLVAVGGLNRDPYLDEARVGRIRHVYVMPEHRGRGVGRLFIEALVDHAGDNFDRVRVRAGPDEAHTFYEAIGFLPTPGEPNSTHKLLL